MKKIWEVDWQKCATWHGMVHINIYCRKQRLKLYLFLGEETALRWQNVPQWTLKITGLNVDSNVLSFQGYNWFDKNMRFGTTCTSNCLKLVGPKNLFFVVHSICFFWLLVQSKAMKSTFLYVRFYWTLRHGFYDISLFFILLIILQVTSDCLQNGLNFSTTVRLLLLADSQSANFELKFSLFKLCSSFRWVLSFHLWPAFHFLCRQCPALRYLPTRALNWCAYSFITEEVMLIFFEFLYFFFAVKLF